MPTEAERLAVLEADMRATKDIVMRMDAKLDMWQSNYYPKEQINEMFRSRDERMANIEEDIKNMQNDRKDSRLTLPQWLIAVGTVCSMIFTGYALLHGR